MGKHTCVITGANSGIGKEAAALMAAKGWCVILACRSIERATAAWQDILRDNPEATGQVMQVDMASPASIKAFARQLSETHRCIDALVNNAAIFDITQQQAKKNGDGVETIWATNHLGPVALTEALLPLLKSADKAKILTISSKGLLATPVLRVDLGDPEFSRRPFRVSTAYYQSKRAQEIYTLWLATQVDQASMTVNCLRVPAVRVDLDRMPNLTPLMRWAYSHKSRHAMDSRQAATLYVRLLTEEAFDACTGKIFNEHLQPIHPGTYTTRDANQEALMRITRAYLDRP